MSRIFSLILAVVFFCADRFAEANNKCSGVTCGYGGECVVGKDKYTCIKCKSGYEGGDNKQCTRNPVRKIYPKLKPLDQGIRIKKPRGGIFLKNLKKIAKQVPSDLKKCVAKNCDICEKKDQSACILCDDKTFLSKKQCVSKCPANTYATNLPKSGRICKSCSSATQRHCTVQCTGFRWEGNACIEGCVLPAWLGKEYLPGTCKLGKVLARGSSCEFKCANHASKAGSADLKYACTTAGVMLVPKSKCQTSWSVYSKREGNGLGLLYTSLVLDWAPTACDAANGFSKLKQGVDSFGHVSNALAALKLPRKDFTPSCRKDTNFRRFPKFSLASKKDYTLLDGALAIKQPVFYFDNVGPRRKWQVSMRSSGSFKTQDGTTVTATLVGTYRTKAQTWTLTWLADKKLSKPFKVSWLEVSEAAAVAQVTAANVTSLGMTGTCVASFSKQYSQRCTLDLLAKKWLLKLNFAAEMSTLQEIVAKFSKFAITDLGLMASLDAHGVMTMYVADTPQRAGSDEIAEGVTVVARTKFVQETALLDLAAGLRVRHTSFTTRFTVGQFAKSPAKPTLTFSSFSNHTITKYWKVSRFGFIVDLQAAKFAFKMAGQLVADIPRSTLVQDITGTILKDVVPKKVVAVADRWRNYYGHVGLDLVNVVTTCDLTNIHLPVLSITAKLPLGDAVVPMSGTVVAAMPRKLYLTGSIAKLSVKQLRSFIGGVFKTKTVVSDASDAIVFPDNQVTLSSRTGHVLLSGKKTYVYRGLYIKTKSQLGGLPIDAAISYNSKNLRNAAMYVSFANPNALNKVILDTKFKLRDAVASQFALNFKDSGHKDLVSALQLVDVETLVPIPEEVAMAPWKITPNATTSMVSLEVEWQKKELLYNLPATFTTQQSSKLVTDLLGMLKFGCRTNNDCKGTAVCSHVFMEGDYDPVYSTWQCVAQCKKGVEYNLKDAGCFPAVQPGGKCWGDPACTTSYCPKGKCVVRKNNGDGCNPAVPEACDSKYCCTLCGTTCQDYPLKSGFNCTKNADCKSGWCREKPGIKSCSQLLKKGDKCDVNSNCKSNYCSVPQKKKCTVQSKLGGPCFFADECISGLSCCFECGFTCQAYPRKDGLACSTNNDCTSKFCHSGVCVSEIPDGGKCSSDKLCASGYCSKVQGNICVRKGADSAKCGLDDDCKSNYCAVNQGKVCFTLIANGVKCASDVQCESGFCNNFDAKGAEIKDKSKWKCAAKLASKAECAKDRMCKSGKCDVCSWWVCHCK